MKLSDQLPRDACPSARAWVDGLGDVSPQAAWDACPDGSWMLWLLFRVNSELAVPALIAVCNQFLGDAKRARRVLELAIRATERLQNNPPDAWNTAWCVLAAGEAQDVAMMVTFGIASGQDQDALVRALRHLANVVRAVVRTPPYRDLARFSRQPSADRVADHGAEDPGAEE